MTYNVETIMNAAIRLPRDVNGNPRYYVHERFFADKNGKLYRPSSANMYRGKQLQSGWVFQSYNLKRTIENAIVE